MYYSLNAWQIRNNHLHKEKEQEEYYKERNNLQQQVSEWYEKQELFKQEDAHFFTISKLERINEPNGRMRKWCTKKREPMDKISGISTRGYQRTNNRKQIFLFYLPNHQTRKAI